MGGKGSGTKSPFAANKPSAVDPDSNSKSLRFTRELMALPDFDRGDAGSMERRMSEFLDMCEAHGMRPMVGGVALALKVDKSTLWKVVNGVSKGGGSGFTPESIEIVKNTLIAIDANFEQLLMDARNPVPAIFYTKSNLGWREAPSETVVTHRSEKPQLQGGTAGEIAAKYRALAGVSEEEEPVYEEQEEEQEEREEARTRV